MKILLAVGVMLAGVEAEASCQTADQACGCDGSQYRWLAKVHTTDATHGAVLEVYGGGQGAPDAGDVLELSPLADAGAGQFWLMSSAFFEQPLTDGGADFVCFGTGIAVPTADWAGSLLDGGCEAQLTSRGWVNPGCRDVGPCGCSAGSAGALALLALTVVLARRALGHR